MKLTVSPFLGTVWEAGMVDSLRRGVRVRRKKEGRREEREGVMVRRERWREGRLNGDVLVFSFLPETYSPLSRSQIYYDRPSRKDTMSPQTQFLYREMMGSTLPDAERWDAHCLQ